MAQLKIDLNKDVDFGRKSRGKMPSKTSINLVIKKKSPLSTRKGMIKLVAGLAVALLLLGLLVVRPIVGLVSLNSRAADLQRQLDEANEQIASMADIEEEYAHYTYEDMTSEELGRVDRVQVMKVVQDALISGGVAKSWTLSGNVMALEVSGASLSQLNQIAQALEKEPIVERCVINTANKGKTEDVAVSFVIYLTKSDQPAAADDTADEADTADDNAQEGDESNDN